MASFVAPLEESNTNFFESTNIDNGKDTSSDYFKDIDTKERCDDTSQEIRRQRILSHQKKNRDASFNSGRKTLETVLYPENEEYMEEELEQELEQEEMETEQIKKKYRLHRTLMLSKWMLEVPEDFTDKWIMVPCPLGQRILLVAYKGLTRAYSRKGAFRYEFTSMLPGGSPKTCQKSFTVLDCIWLRSKRVYYVLDVLAWGVQEMVHCEAEFRFYWIKSKLEEMSELKVRNWKNNRFPILSLPNVNCDHDLYECLESISSSLQLDGVLFFHKEQSYTSGKTPLVVWLKTYMLPEVLGISVPEPFDEKPYGYISFEDHVLQVTKRERAQALAKSAKTKTSCIE